MPKWPRGKKESPSVELNLCSKLTLRESLSFDWICSSYSASK